MKRTISIIITSIIIGALIAYCIVLLAQQGIAVSSSFAGKESIAAIALIVMLLAIRFYSTIGGSRLDKPKLTLSVLGVVLIFVGAYVFVDAADSGVFLSDLIRVTGVYVLIAGVSGFIGVSGDTKNTSTGSAHRVKGAEVIEI